ncbi:hypothetical protein UlMin_026048 [Ulmus minor]
MKSQKGGFDHFTKTYHSLLELDQNHKIPTRTDLNIASSVLSHFPNKKQAISKVAFIDSSTNQTITYYELHQSVGSLASALYKELRIQKGDVVLILSQNTLLYPIMCLAVLSTGAILTTSDPLKTKQEISKQPELVERLNSTGLPVVLTRCSTNFSAEELIEHHEPLVFSHAQIAQTDVAAILFTSGTTGQSKGVCLTHGNFVSSITLLKWSLKEASDRDDVFLCMLPMFHVYVFVFFVLGLPCIEVKTVLMEKYELEAMVDAVQIHKVTYLPSTPSVIVEMVKSTSFNRLKLSSLKRVLSGGGKLKSCGAATCLCSDDEAKAHSGSSGMLVPGVSARVVGVETGEALQPCRKGEIWLKSSIGCDGWLRTGDLCYFDEDGFVAPAELEAILLAHPQILDAAVIPVEDEAGQVPVAYLVRAVNSELTEDQVILFIANPNVEKVNFVNAIPRSATVKTLRNELLLLSKHNFVLKSCL